MDSADTLPVAAGRAAAGERWRLSRAARAGPRAYAAVSLVSLLISLYLTWHLLGGFGQRMIAGNPDDVRLFEWYLVHGPWAVLHGHDPLLFTTMNAPAGVNGMWNTPLLVPALIISPVTALAARWPPTTRCSCLAWPPGRCARSRCSAGSPAATGRPRWAGSCSVSPRPCWPPGSATWTWC